MLGHLKLVLTRPGSLTPIKTDILLDFELTGIVLGIGLQGQVLEIKNRTTGELCALKPLPNTPKGRQEVDLHYKALYHRNIIKIQAVYEQEWRGEPSILMVLERYV